jgi:hypothetical protein
MRLPSPATSLWPPRISPNLSGGFGGYTQTTITTLETGAITRQTDINPANGQNTSGDVFSNGHIGSYDPNSVVKVEERNLNSSDPASAVNRNELNP